MDIEPLTKNRFSGRSCTCGLSDRKERSISPHAHRIFTAFSSHLHAPKPTAVVSATDTSHCTIRYILVLSISCCYCGNFGIRRIGLRSSPMLTLIGVMQGRRIADMGREEGSRDVGRADGSTQPVKHLGERHGAVIEHRRFLLSSHDSRDAADILNLPCLAAAEHFLLSKRWFQRNKHYTNIMVESFHSIFSSSLHKKTSHSVVFNHHLKIVFLRFIFFFL